MRLVRQKFMMESSLDDTSAISAEIGTRYTTCEPNLASKHGRSSVENQCDKCAQHDN